MVLSLFESSPILKQVAEILSDTSEIYLVGGAIRDFLLNRPLQDFDFVLPRHSLKSARRVADALQGDYYVLDPERHSGRVIICSQNGSRIKLDFSQQRGSSLEDDLRSRDFCANAIALNLHHPDHLIDPSGGLTDVQKKILRAPSSNAFEDDPLRVLRGIRLAVQLDFRLEKTTWHWMRQAVGGLRDVSAERRRDEIFRLLSLGKAASALRLVEMAGLWPVIFPDDQESNGLTGKATALELILSRLQKLEIILAILSREGKLEEGGNLASGLIAVHLGRYREYISTWLKEEMVLDRTRRSLLLLVALDGGGHVVGSPTDGIQNLSNSAESIEQSQLRFTLQASALCLSNAETEWGLKVIGGSQMIAGWFDKTREVDDHQVYRFFNAYLDGGVGSCLIALAGWLDLSQTDLNRQAGLDKLDVIRRLFETWWEHRQEKIAPPPLVNGFDLMEALGFSPGVEIGRLLAELREAQACGEIYDREEALRLARKLGVEHV